MFKRSNYFFLIAIISCLQLCLVMEVFASGPNFLKNGEPETVEQGQINIKESVSEAPPAPTPPSKIVEQNLKEQAGNKPADAKVATKTPTAPTNDKTPETSSADIQKALESAKKGAVIPPTPTPPTATPRVTQQQPRRKQAQVPRYDYIGGTMPPLANDQGGVEVWTDKDRDETVLSIRPPKPMQNQQQTPPIYIVPQVSSDGSWSVGGYLSNPNYYPNQYPQQPYYPAYPPYPPYPPIISDQGTTQQPTTPEQGNTGGTTTGTTTGTGTGTTTGNTTGTGTGTGTTTNQQTYPYRYPPNYAYPQYPQYPNQYPNGYPPQWTNDYTYNYRNQQMHNNNWQYNYPANTYFGRNPNIKHRPNEFTGGNSHIARQPIGGHFPAQPKMGYGFMGR